MQKLKSKRSLYILYIIHFHVNIMWARECKKTDTHKNSAKSKSEKRHHHQNAIKIKIPNILNLRSFNSIFPFLFFPHQWSSRSFGSDWFQLRFVVPNRCFDSENFKMSMPKPNQVAVRDLVEEAKKRIVILIVCVVGLSYLMSCEWNETPIVILFLFNFNSVFFILVSIAFCFCFGNHLLKFFEFIIS
jgi:hypothetical protein